MKAILMNRTTGRFTTIEDRDVLRFQASIGTDIYKDETIVCSTEYTDRLNRSGIKNAGRILIEANLKPEIPAYVEDVLMKLFDHNDLVEVSEDLGVAVGTVKPTSSL